MLYKMIISPSVQQATDRTQNQSILLNEILTGTGREGRGGEGSRGRPTSWVTPDGKRELWKETIHCACSPGARRL